MNIRIDTIQTPRIPTPVIRRLEPPVTRTILPVTRGLEVPVVDVPDFELDYPVIDLPLEPLDINVPVVPDSETPENPRNPADPTPVVEVPPNIIEVAGVEVELPEPSVLATAASLAVITTVTTMAAGLALNQIKGPIESLIKRKFKIKIKLKKPVIHYSLCPKDNSVNIFEYTAEGTNFVDHIEDVEKYIRDVIDMSPFYEVENKIIIDDSLKSKFTKEGVKRFKSHFTPSKLLAKKLSAKFSF